MEVMKNRAYHEDIKCSSFEAISVQPMKIGLNITNLPDDAIDIFAKEELKKIISGQDGDEQNDPTEDPTVEENDLLDITDAEGSVLEFQEKTCEEDVSSTEMVTEIPRSPSISAQQKNKITEKQKIVKSNLQTQAFKMTRLAREKFLLGKFGDTVKIRVPDVDRGRCDSRNILGVIMEVDLTKDLYRIGTKDGIRNLWYARNQLSTSTEGTVNIKDIPSVNISLRECSGTASPFGGQGYRRCNCKTSCRCNLCFACAKSQTSYGTLNVTIVYRAKINDICFDIIMFYISFVLFFFSFYYYLM